MDWSFILYILHAWDIIKNAIILLIHAASTVVYPQVLWLNHNNCEKPEKHLLYYVKKKQDNNIEILRHTSLEKGAENTS